MWFLEKYKHFRLYVRNTHIGARQKAEKSLWDHVEKAHEGPTDRLIVTWQMIDFFGLRYVLFFFSKRRNYFYFFVSNIYSNIQGILGIQVKVRMKHFLLWGNRQN